MFQFLNATSSSCLTETSFPLPPSIKPILRSISQFALDPMQLNFLNSHHSGPSQQFYTAQKHAPLPNSSVLTNVYIWTSQTDNKIHIYINTSTVLLTSAFLISSSKNNQISETDFFPHKAMLIIHDQPLNFQTYINPITWDFLQ